MSLPSGMTKLRFRTILEIFAAVALLCGPAGIARAQTPGEPAAGGQENQQVVAPAAPNERFDSPRSTLTTYFDAMNRAQNKGLPSSERLRALDEAAECFDLSGLEPESGRALATDLQEIVNRIGAVRARIRFVPNLSEANARGLDRYQLFPDESRESGWMHVLDGYEPVRSAAPNGLLALARDETGEWRFDKDTVEGLAEFRRLVGELEAEIGSATIALTPDRVIRSWMPAPLRNGAVFGLEYWQWLGLVVFIFAGIVLDYSVRFAIRRTWRRIMQQRGREADRPLLKRAVRPFGLFASALLFYWTVRLLGLPPRALVFVLAAVRVFLMLSTVWAAFRVTDLLGEFLASKAAATATKFDDLLVPLVRKTAKVLIFAVGLIYIADTFRIEILPLLTGLGIGGLAFAFAAKDTIEKLFGSVAVVVDRPFEVGDWVVIGDVEGTVEELGFRSTRIRTFYNSLVSVPNSTLVRATVDNYGRRRFRRVKMHLGLTYDTPPEKIEAFCEGIRELIRIHPYTRNDYYHVWFNRFGPSSLDVLVYAFHQCADWGTELRERHRLFLDILRLAERLGVQFAFPTQTLHVLQQEADTDHTPAPPPDESAEMDASRVGIEAAGLITRDAQWRESRPGPVSYRGRPSNTQGPLQAETE